LVAWREESAACYTSHVGETGDDVAELAYSMGPTNPPLLDETIGHNLRRIAAASPNAEALVSCHQDMRFTYAEFDAAVDDLAAGLIDLGLGVGDRLGIWSPNRAEWVVLQYATARVGIVLVTLNPAYRTSELRYAVQQSGCKVVVAVREFKGGDYAGMLHEIRPDTPDLEQVILFDSPEWRRLATGGIHLGHAAVAERAATLHPDDPINIQYTSGTTGFPKGATLSHRNILNNGFFVGERCGYTDADRVCIPVPFYHCFGMVLGNLACTTHGAAMVIPGEAFDPVDSLRAVSDERCTSLYGVPTMFIAELEVPGFDEFDLSTLRTGIMAGSPCPVEVMKQVVDRMNMSEVTICYGMTETSPVSTQTTAGDTLDQRVGTVGPVHPHVEVKVVDPESGETLERGAKGELCTRGYSVMLGYWNDSDRTAEAIDADGWMHTGDLAVMDEDGYLDIVGRSKDMIIRGGENVYPREIEEFLYTHPQVSDVQVVGVPDPRYGEEIAAFVKAVGDPSLSEQDVRDFCRGAIAHFKVPRYVFFVDEFPMTVTGKIQKFMLRDQAISELA
jgi:fatty-acyl-CoA synthase